MHSLKFNYFVVIANSIRKNEIKYFTLMMTIKNSTPSDIENSNPIYHNRGIFLQR